MYQWQFSYENSCGRGCKRYAAIEYASPRAVRDVHPCQSFGALPSIFFFWSLQHCYTNNWGRVLLLFGSASFIMRCHRISKNTRVWHCDLNQKQEQLVKVDGFVDIYAEWWHLPFFCYVNSHILPSSFLKKYMWLKKGQCSQLFNTLLSNSL
jgi:hypothetical protein